jgi:hypothetical protein
MIDYFTGRTWKSDDDRGFLYTFGMLDKTTAYVLRVKDDASFELDDKKMGTLADADSTELTVNFKNADWGGLTGEVTGTIRFDESMQQDSTITWVVGGEIITWNIQELAKG